MLNSCLVYWRCGMKPAMWMPVGKDLIPKTPCPRAHMEVRGCSFHTATTKCWLLCGRIFRVEARSPTASKKTWFAIQLPNPELEGPSVMICCWIQRHIWVAPCSRWPVANCNISLKQNKTPRTSNSSKSSDLFRCLWSKHSYRSRHGVSIVMGVPLSHHPCTN